MAKRIIHECDLTKREYDPEDTVKITITRKSKKGRAYEISSDAAEMLEKQLVAGEELVEGWDFHGVEQIYSPQEVSPAPRQETKFIAEEEDSELKAILEKKRRIQANDEEEHPKRAAKKEDWSDYQPKRRLGDCMHMNKGGIQFKDDAAYRVCKNCGAKVPEKKRTEQSEYMGAKPAAGTKLKDYNK